MKIDFTVNNSTFNGYDARPLKGFIMSGNCHNIAKEMQNIGKKEGFNVFSIYKDELNRTLISEILPESSRIALSTWAQDNWTIYKNKLFAAYFKSKSVFISEKFDFYNKTLESGTAKNIEIPGGNLYFIKEEDNSDSILVGTDELEYFGAKEIRKKYGVDKVIFLPQMDYHLDLFIRPLDNKRILVADDNETLKVLNNILRKLYDLPLEKKSQEVVSAISSVEYQIKLFELAMKNNNLPQTKEIAKILENNGFVTIKVPGRLYSVTDNLDKSELQHDCNYINANVLKNSDGDLVYITNKSGIDNLLGLTPEIISEIKTSFEDSYAEAILPYVKKEHLYFIEGDKNFVSKLMLLAFRGGIHCACTEIPNDDIISKGIKENDKNRKNKWWNIFTRKKKVCSHS